VGVCMCVYVHCAGKRHSVTHCTIKCDQVRLTHKKEHSLEPSMSFSDNDMKEKTKLRHINF